MSIAAMSWVVRGGPDGGPVVVDLDACRARNIGEHKVWHVLFVLAEAANKLNADVWLGRDTIGELARMHRRDVDKCVAVLVESKLVERQRPAGGPGRPPVLRLMLSNPNPHGEWVGDAPSIDDPERAVDAPSIDDDREEVRAVERAVVRAVVRAVDARREPEPEPEPEPSISVVEKSTAVATESANGKTAAAAQEKTNNGEVGPPDRRHPRSRNSEPQPISTDLRYWNRRINGEDPAT